MTIYRANTDTVKKIMTGKMHARAFTIFGVGSAIDSLGVSSAPQKQGLWDGGADFRMRLDSAARTYTPPQASPKKYWQETDGPGTYIEIMISVAFPLLICNGNFECYIPDDKGAALRGVLNSLGWTVEASPVDATFPPAKNLYIPSVQHIDFR